MDAAPCFSPILAYQGQPARVRDHDPRASAVAGHVGRRIAAARPGTVVEHVGSTAVAGLPGKGVIDLLVVAGARPGWKPPGPPGTSDPGSPADAGPHEVPAIVDALLGLGFQRQGGPDPMPPERPMLVGTIDHDGARFRIHVHVVPAHLPEAAELIGFRDALRADPAMRAAYTVTKRAIVAGGSTDSRRYSQLKGEWVRAELDRLARLAGPVGPVPDLDTDRALALVPDQGTARGAKQGARKPRVDTGGP